MLTIDEERGVSVFSGNVDFTAQIVLLSQKIEGLQQPQGP